MINASVIRESVAQKESRNFVVSTVQYGNRIFDILDSKYCVDEAEARKVAEGIKIPPNCYVEIRKKVNEDFVDDTCVIWRSDRPVDEAGKKGDYGLNPSKSDNGPKESDKPAEIGHEAGATDKLKPEKAPNETGKENVPPVSKPESHKGEATGTNSKAGLQHQKAPNESKVTEATKSFSIKLPTIITLPGTDFFDVAEDTLKNFIPNVVVDGLGMRGGDGIGVAYLKGMKEDPSVVKLRKQYEGQLDPLEHGDEEYDTMEAKKNEGKVPKSAADDKEPDLIKQLTEKIQGKLKDLSKEQLQKVHDLMFPAAK